MQARVFLLLLLALLLTATTAEARKERELGWRFSQVWASSVRLLRVDMKCTILEKDKDTGYLLFECADGAKTSQGSLELMRASASAKYAVKAALHMERLPSYMESLWLDKLVRKLKTDFGDPVVFTPSIPQSPAKSASVKKAGAKDGAALEGAIEDEKDLEVDEEELEDANEER